MSRAFGSTSRGVLGVQSEGHPDNWHIQHYDLVDSTRSPHGETWFVIARTGGYLGGLVRDETADQLSGPIRIAEVSGAMAKIGLRRCSICRNSVDFGRLPEPLSDPAPRRRPFFLLRGRGVRGRAMNDKVQQFGSRSGSRSLGLIIFARTMILFAWTR